MNSSTSVVDVPHIAIQRLQAELSELRDEVDRLRRVELLGRSAEEALARSELFGAALSEQEREQLGELLSRLPLAPTAKECTE